MRNPTVRIDAASHAALADLAARFNRVTGNHHSLADMVRVGITLSARHISEQETQGKPPANGSGRAERGRCGLCNDDCEPVNHHGDCIICARMQYGDR